MKTKQVTHQRFNFRGVALQRLLKLAKQHNQNPHEYLMTTIMNAHLDASETTDENTN